MILSLFHLECFVYSLKRFDKNPGKSERGVEFLQKFIYVKYKARAKEMFDSADMAYEHRTD